MTRNIILGLIRNHIKNLSEHRREENCLGKYANNKGADQPAHKSSRFSDKPYEDIIKSLLDPSSIMTFSHSVSGPYFCIRE